MADPDPGCRTFSADGGSDAAAALAPPPRSELDCGVSVPPEVDAVDPGAREPGLEPVRAEPREVEPGEVEPGEVEPVEELASDVLPARLIPAPNSDPELSDPAGAPRAVPRGIAYCFATGLLGSTWTPVGSDVAAASEIVGAVSPPDVPSSNVTTVVSSRKLCLLVRKSFLPLEASLRAPVKRSIRSFCLRSAPPVRPLYLIAGLMSDFVLQRSSFRRSSSGSRSDGRRQRQPHSRRPGC